MFGLFAHPVLHVLGCCWEQMRKAQTGATIPNIIKPKTLGVVASVLAVVCKRMQHFPTIMLGPALHCGKDTTHKTLETTCNERALRLSSWKGCANGSVRDFKIQRRGRQRERQKNNRFYK